MRAEGLAALIATHNFELAARMDRALLLHQGKLIAGIADARRVSGFGYAARRMDGAAH